jgi:hypothetical protein
MLSTGILTSSGLVSGWTFRRQAQVVAADADELQVIASARVQMNGMAMPLLAISKAGELGINEADLATLFKPEIRSRCNWPRAPHRSAVSRPSFRRNACGPTPRNSAR